MATVLEKNVLELHFDDGMKNGKQQIKRKSYSNIKLNALDTGLKSASSAIDVLSKKEVLNTKKVATSRIEA